MNHRISSLLYLLIPVVVFTVVMTFIDADTIVDSIGINNTYIVMFIIALLGGLSLFSGIPYPLIMITLAIGGSNVLYLAVVTTLGVMLGDSSSYFIGNYVSNRFSGTVKKAFNKILNLYDTHPNYLPLVFFLYGSISPLPNDLITLSSGIKKYPYRKMIIPLTLGNFIFAFVIGYYADYFAQFF